jgi:peptidoglycan-associated lipoprotein
MVMRFSGQFGRACKIAGIFVAVIAIAACSKKNQPGEYGYGVGSVGAAEPGSARDFSVNVGDVVHFQVDSSALTGEAQSILQRQSGWLNQYPQYTITIEGHADERGTREYNIALGARRAMSVKMFLGQQGVNPARIRTISYGKERPIAVCDDISCWSQNRRAQTVLNNPAMASRY